MYARITPAGRASRIFRVHGGSRSWDIAGGCATATLPIRLTDEDLERILLARVDIFGPRGLDWSGVVWRKPRENAPIECAGLAAVLGFNRRCAMYLDTRTSAWSERTYANKNTSWWRTQIDGPYIRCIGSGTVATDDFTGVIYRKPEATDTYISFDWVRPATDVEILLLWDTYSLVEATGHEAGGSWAHTDPVAAYGSGNLTGTYTNTITDAHDLIGLNVRYGAAPGTEDQQIYFKNVKVYGVAGLTTLTPEAVIEDNVDQMPTWAMPAGDAYRDFIAVSGDSVDSLYFDDPQSTDKAKVDAVTNLNDHHFGFYARRVAGKAHVLPVYEPLETSPSLLLDATRLPSESLKERAADELASSYIVNHTDEEGRTRYVMVADPDTASYLATIGRTIIGAVDASWTASTTTATAAGTEAAAQAATRGAEGSATIIRARLASGRDTSPLDCMPGRMVLMRGMGAGRELLISHTEATDEQVSVAFSEQDLSLKFLAARALSRRRGV